MDIDDLERIAARHWQAPETEPLGDWLLRAAAGFTGRANSALPVGDPGTPLPAAVTLVEDWYRRRGLPPMIVVPGARQNGAAPASLDLFLAERSWVLRAGPAFVMTAAIAGLPAPFPDTDVRLDPEPDAAWLALYRYRGQDLPPIARTLMMSAPWQAFASIRRDGRAVAVGRISVAGRPAALGRPAEPWGAITAVEVDAGCRRQGLGVAITAALAATAASRGRVTSCCRSRQATRRPARFTLGADSATRTATITAWRPHPDATRGGRGAWVGSAFSLRL